ncbi:MAG TPA: GGDEF domain-containing protein [Candidatus Edwardsbacteria bacterium]|nr:GGDEF domain-containing protein [Candidatus Edwardsbacteria bacterium]
MVDFALQPIVNIHTGDCYGVECLLRDTADAGFTSIQDFFDQAFRDRLLYQVDLQLRAAAIAKFAALPFHRSITMFYNIDNRIMLMPDFLPGRTSLILKEHGLPNQALCFELSERHDITSNLESKAILSLNKQQSYKIAIDDFGSGFSGLQQLYHSEPDFIKIDRFFIAGLAEDARKRLFVTAIIDLAHVLGVEVIAEGVETENEFYACKQIGCDFVQGFLVQVPQQDILRIKPHYQLVADLNHSDRRQPRDDKTLIAGQVEAIEPIRVPDHDIRHLFERFRRDHYATFFPVVTKHGEPVGIVREKDFKEFVYSPYGKDLLMNRSAGRALADFISKCPVAELNSRLERVVEQFALCDSPEGILVTRNGRYAGFLTAGAILNAIHEKSLDLARDQNPLTKLPGNVMIGQYIAERLQQRGRPTVFLHFDIDNFKPFNDRYGFRIGDRAIMLFADLLRKAASQHGLFAGHIGGDDFFAAGGYHDEDIEPLARLAPAIVAEFADCARMLFDEDDRRRGYYESIGRDGNPACYPLLTVSAVVIFLQTPAPLPGDELGRLTAKMKGRAKRSPDRLAWITV